MAMIHEIRITSTIIIQYIMLVVSFEILIKNSEKGRVTTIVAKLEAMIKTNFSIYFVVIIISNCL